jgi:NhaA family Na+:H+ antiporter
MSSPDQLSDLPPGASPSAARVVRALKRPIDRFLELEAAGSMLLLVAASAALLWANSPWAASYRALWETPIHIAAAGRTIDPTLHFLVNDLLMAVFFFAVGLELRRELHAGELSGARRAALPVFAAVGGMLVPAGLYLALNPGALARGWGVPMATDIAFAVGVLALLGSRVAPSMRVFLLALAIIDDIGAILVIAIFYSSGGHLDGLGLALVGIVGIIGLQRLGARHASIYAVPAAAIWLGMYRTGVHPTVAGVIVGLMTPAVSRYGPQQVGAAAGDPPGSSAQPDSIDSMKQLHRMQSEQYSPVERLERAFHPWVVFVIMPVFAFANAGVDVASVRLAAHPTLALGIAAGLVIGKPLGILAASGLAVRLRIASLPPGLTWRGVAVVGAVAGIGFTMALFVAELAFAGRAELYGNAKLVVLLSSAIAAAAGVLLGRSLLGRNPAAVSVCPAQDRKRLIPELERGPLAYVLLVFGVVCAALELFDPDRVHGRLVLFLVVATAGILGIVRRRRPS